MTTPGADRPTRVLVLDHTGELGGAELALVRLCLALGPEVDVRVLLFSDGPLVERLRAAGVATEVIALDRRTSTTSRESVGRASLSQLVSLLRLVPFSWALARRVRGLRPDVVHTTSLKADLLGVVPARWARSALVWHVHDRIADDYLPSRVARVFRWAAARFPDAVIVNSEATASTLPVGTTVAYPGFGAGQDLAGPRPPLPAGRSGPVVGMIGRISRTKGQLELVRAARTVLDRHPDADFRVVGEPSFGAEEYADQVRAEAERLGVADHVTWVGFVADPSTELDGFDVCVHASPVPEPFGQVVVEAMIREVPVVAARAGGVVEILAGPPGEPALGLLVEPGDEESLAQGILAVLDAPGEARDRAVRAAVVARRRYSAARTAEVVSGVWLRAAGRAR
ncbi:glycosyltransferase [Oerskovia enterophila]|uniref:D-inositol 3-phosphate glycosyltransferase n=1 Tax=Oerskovia enterophila TaxID=43678 RepID=A0A163S404_9CELL|nr:glycosyltransferase [Oerskovia enterophila]KZM35992.1 D-inositol 3-phosphate glycosyltransferase [Oerskovia enterophila]